MSIRLKLIFCISGIAAASLWVSPGAGLIARGPNLDIARCEKKVKTAYVHATRECERQNKQTGKRFKCKMDVYRLYRTQHTGCTQIYGELPGNRRRCERRADDEFRRRIKSCQFRNTEQAEMQCRRDLRAQLERRKRSCSKFRP